jgi:ectoine hydroxylase-related dioxygenase (phytanoyl-CoA dioxygenase family)
MRAASPDVRLGADPAIDEWIVQDVLPTHLIEELKRDLDRALGDEQRPEAQAELQLRMFEQSNANLRLFDRDPIASFAEHLIGDDRPEFGAEAVHVVHNNSFRTRRSQGIAHWHQDEPPYYVVTEGKPPTNVKLPVLLFTCNYYLTDVTAHEYGPTEFISGSHLFGSAPPKSLEGTEWESRIQAAYGKAGTAILFSCQTWHRGSPNCSDRVRYVTQVSYAHRTIGHRYFPFMNYVLPEHVMADADENPRLKRLLGFVPAGPYG